ncbi:MAG: RNA methyltransferase [Acidimicrobiales bacterium]
MPPTTIDDPDDPRVADYRQLNDAGFRRQVEAPGPFHKGMFVVEGWLPVERLLPSRFGARSVLVDSAKVERAETLLHGRAVPLLAADRAVLDAIVGFPLHRGVVAAAERGLPILADGLIRRSRRLVVLDGVNDAENMGAIIRNAVALGADALLLDPTSCDPLSRRSVRVSVGHALSLPFARPSWPDTLDRLRSEGVATIALTPRRDATPIAELELTDDQRIAMVLGAEGPGLSDDVVERCDRAARIPMARGIDSLNVASAAAIALNRLFDLGG